MVKAGYKQTDIGVVPNDWEVKQIKDFTDGTAGGTPTTSNRNFWGGNIRWMSSGELNKKVICDVEGRITEEGLNSSSTKLIPMNCVLIGLAGQGKTRGTVAINKISLCTNQSIAAIYPSQQYVSNYLYYNLEQRYSELRSMSTGDGGRGGLNLTIIRNIKLAFPKIKEQKAIAKALSDTDELIASLEKLIAKKQAIKQGTMQQLLTGKKRLSGFSGEWQEKRLGSLCDMSSGGTPSTKIPNYYGGGIPWLSISDITLAGKYIYKTEKSLSQLGLSNSAAKLFDKGILLLAMYASIGKCCISEVDISTSQAILGIKTNSQIDTQFLYYYFLLSKNQLASSGQQGTQSNLNKGMVEDIKLSLPQVEEQNAIAKILADMDNELESLKTKLSKIKAVKDGMMSELLTGKTRLI